MSDPCYLYMKFTVHMCVSFYFMCCSALFVSISTTSVSFCSTQCVIHVHIFVYFVLTYLHRVALMLFFRLIASLHLHVTGNIFGARISYFFIYLEHILIFLVVIDFLFGINITYWNLSSRVEFSLFNQTLIVWFLQ